MCVHTLELWSIAGQMNKMEQRPEAGKEVINMIRQVTWQ